MEKPPVEPQVASQRPVRTTPGGMLDPKSMHALQSALNQHGVKTPMSGQLDDETQASLEKFQKREKMAATGMPDYDTLRKLGLNPKTIYLGGTKRADSRIDRKTGAPKGDEAAKNDSSQSDSKPDSKGDSKPDSKGDSKPDSK